MIQGRCGEYTVRIIKRGARAAPILPAIVMIPVAVALEVQKIQRESGKNPPVSSVTDYFALIMRDTTTVFRHVKTDSYFSYVLLFACNFFSSTQVP